jgi:hypothetical protein
VKEYQIALNIVKSKLSNKQSFSVADLQKEVIEAGGILRIAMGFSIGDYIAELEEDGYIEYNPDSGKYTVL